MPGPSRRYFPLLPGHHLPALSPEPTFKAVLIADAVADELWMWDACRWLAAAGCRCLMTWGTEAESWREGFEEAHLELVDHDALEGEQAIVATSHPDDELEEVFWYAKHRARHPVIELPLTYLFHVSASPRREEIESLYDRA
ncbi:DUF7684 family protein [Noviherbaspirillum galbum]|uniref:DUF7684 domain-containing protein n=1 Tax=Noviherbaspirillum galbum TaxID=2709383 RepID=A0A6B3ST53_9BURK|nr:hypothetical protein [Noviherbaspirillum galbum]NEX63953.1 hypothetical protein [Noviherbaspirillum galbum]